MKRQRLTYGPWVIFPLAAMSWTGLGILAATVLHALCTGGGS